MRGLLDHAGRLRKEQTDAEARIWSHLRNQQLGAKFRRQHRAEGFILDFACVELMLAIELDGGQHGERQEQDANRARILESAGWEVLRYWNHDVLTAADVVLDDIWRVLERRRLNQKLPPHPNPLPRRRGRGDQPIAASPAGGAF